MVFGNCGDYQIGIVNDIVIGEDFWVVGLEGVFVVFWGDNMVLGVQFDVVFCQLFYVVWMEVKCYDYGVSWYYVFRVGDDFCVVVVFCIWLVYFGVCYFYVVNFIVGIYFYVQWLDVKLEFNVFFVCVFYFVF